MRDFSKVSGNFWTGGTGREIRGDLQTQVVAMYLMTTNHSNMIGVYHCPILYIAHETGSPLEGATKGLARLIEGGFCTYDQDSETVWVHEMAKFQIGGPLAEKDLRVKGIQKIFDALPDNAIKSMFYERYKTEYRLKYEPKTPPKTQAPSKPLASPLQAPTKPEEGEGEGEEEGEVKTLRTDRTKNSLTLTGEFLPASPAGRKDPKPEIDTDLQKACKATWDSYAAAYAKKYGVAPIRNAPVNSQIKAMVQRVGREESPFVAAFYLTHSDAYYVRRAHDTATLLKDCEKLRMEWATGRKGTAAAARQADRTQTNAAAGLDALAMLQQGA